MSNENRPFLDIKFDEFEAKTTLRHITSWGWSVNKSGHDYFWWRAIEVKGSRSLLLDVDSKYWDGFVDPSEIIFIIDGQRLSFPFVGQHTEVVDGGDGVSYCRDYGRIKLTRPDLKRICDASELKLRVKGRHLHSDSPAGWGAGFIKYSRQFYNNYFDPSAYPEAVAGGPSRSGCFIATAAMGSSSCYEVAVLRRYRDRILRRNKLGRLFVKNYYLLSPPIARFIAGKKIPKIIVRAMVVRPASWIASRMLSNRRPVSGEHAFEVRAPVDRQ